MTTVRQFHNEAMRFAQLALIAREEGRKDDAISFARQAFVSESRAAALIPVDEKTEPTRSILYRSAASLAFQANELAEAQRLVANGLSGYPPVQIEYELKTLFEQINYQMHLEVRGAKLEEADIQMSLSGNAVGYGIVSYDDFIKRLEGLKSLVNRTIQRLMGRVYQRGGRVAQSYKSFTPSLLAPRPGSFTIILQLVRQQDAQLPLFIDSSKIFHEILVGIDLINNLDFEGLKRHIPQSSYYQNFVSLAKEIAPDGDRISFVGFTSLNQTVGLTKQRNFIEITPTLDPQKSESDYSPISIEGTLDYAKSRGDDIVGLTTEDGRNYYIRVEEGVDDLVRNHFKELVTVTGMYDGRYIYLSDIRSP